MGLPAFTCSEETLRKIPATLREHGFTVRPHHRASGREGLLLAITASRGFGRVHLIGPLRRDGEHVVFYIIQSRPIIDSRLFRDITSILFDHGISPEVA